MYTLFKDFIYIIVPFIAWLLTQWLKPVFEYLRTGNWNFKIAKGSGGMPSSHSSTMIALTTIIGFGRGLDSESFAIALVLSLIVMYDARGVRQAAGSHAIYLNQIKDELHDLLGKAFTIEGFKTNLGHTSIQVAVGGFLGLIIGIIFGVIFF